MFGKTKLIRYFAEI